MPSPAQPTRSTLVLKARYVFPVEADPIPEGTVTIRGGQIVAVGRETRGGPIHDLGNVALLPGFVNAHTHLELSDLDQPLGRAGMGFVEWLRAVVAYRQRRRSPMEHAVGRGIDESRLAGTVAVGEIAQPGWNPDGFERAGLHAVIYLELIAPTVARAEAAFESAWQHIGRSGSAGVWRPGLSPHAPYTVPPDWLRRLLGRLAQHDQVIPIAFHLAESREELELLRFGTGPLREFLGHMGAWSPDIIPRGTRPLDYLRLLASARRVAVIHGNYLDEEEIALLAEHRKHMAVVYCPRTHAYFGHEPYPLEKLLLAGVPVALGTDSRASSPDLSILAEMRTAARRHPSVAKSVVLRMATLWGAEALGWDGVLGSLAPGKWAELAAVSLPDRQSGDPYELLFDSDTPITALPNLPGLPDAKGQNGRVAS